MASIISAGTTSGTALNMTADTSGQLQLATGASPTTALTIDTSQNVGIGTTSPSGYAAKLSVIGNGIYTNYGYALTVDSTYFTPSGLTAIPNYGLGNPASSQVSLSAFAGLTFYTNQAERMRIDSSGNVGIGVTSPGSKLGVLSSVGAWGMRVATTYGTNDSGFYFDGSGNAQAVMRDSSGNNSYITNTSNNMQFATGGTERMRIDSSGNLLMGYTTLPTNSGLLNVNGNIAWGNQSGTGRIYSDANWGCLIQASKSSPGAHVFGFLNSAGTGLMYLDATLGTGTVYSNGGSLTNTNPSDATLKTNVQDLSLGLDFIIKLRPVTFDWINDKAEQGTQYGFIAQEVQEIEPSLVKEFEHIDSQDEENPVKSKKLGLEEKAIHTALVKAIQEQQTIINDLKARIETLEGAK